MALPEHAPHIPHIPVPDLRGGLKWALTHWPVVGGATLTLAGAGLGIQMLTGTDRGPSTPPVDNAPVSDTFKPPKGGPNVGIVTPPQSPDNPSVSVPAGPDGSDKPPKPLAPEIKVAPVEIFPKEMDPYIEIINLLNAKKQHVFIIGIKGLPEGITEVPIATPIVGKLWRATNDPNYIAVQDLNDVTLTSFAFNGFKPDEEKPVQPGDRIGVLKDTGFREKRLGNKEYIATIDVYTKNPSTGQADWEKAKEIVKEFFPRAPIVYAEFNPTQVSNSPQPKKIVVFEDEKPAGLR